jgi:hypothetical protein
MEKLTYRYVERDLLKTPEKYQMTPFEGIEFLSAYKESRKKILDVSDFNNNFNVNESISNLTITSQNDEILSQEILSTDELLLFIYRKNEHVPNIIHKTYLDNIIKKFEVRKKIYEQYDNQMQESSSNYNNITNYVLLSINCLIAYEKSQNLRYLNTSLKINDLLISQIDRIDDKNLLMLCKFAFKLELDSINKLCQTRGIDLK